MNIDNIVRVYLPNFFIASVETRVLVLFAFTTRLIATNAKDKNIRDTRVAATTINISIACRLGKLPDLKKEPPNALKVGAGESNGISNEIMNGIEKKSTTVDKYFEYTRHECPNTSNMNFFTEWNLKTFTKVGN